MPRQAIAILEELRAITGHGVLVFPGLRTDKRPISENTLNGALRRLGYSKDEALAHGFRATASTMLNESGLWSHDAIERALAHQDPPSAGHTREGPMATSGSACHNGGPIIWTSCAGREVGMALEHWKGENAAETGAGRPSRARKRGARAKMR